jgi:hypothetical protein
MLGQLERGLDFCCIEQTKEKLVLYKDGKGETGGSVENGENNKRRRFDGSWLLLSR